MNNTKVIQTIIESIKNDELEDALYDTYHIEGPSDTELLRSLRTTLRSGNKEGALYCADRCLGRC